MKRALLWSLVVSLLLLAFFLFTVLFAWLFREPPAPELASTNTPVPTFTPAPSPTVLVVAKITPDTPTPRPSPTSSPSPVPTPTDIPTATPTPIVPQVVSSITVNVRAGPGTNYPVISSMAPDEPLVVIGRNEARSWWQVLLPGGTAGWVADSVVEATATGAIAIAEAPPPPTPTPTPVPPVPTRPRFQFEPTGWYGDTNYGLTRFLGNITDVNGNPVNGAFVEAQCGTYRVISNPSGPVAGSMRNDSADDPPGFYDITIDKRPIPCKWHLTVVSSADGGRTVSGKLSDAILVETTIDETIIVANWRKNW